MKQTIIIFPFCKRLKDGTASPKEYPYWLELVELLNKEFEVIQISHSSEPKIDGVKIKIDNLPLEAIVALCKKSFLYISCDSFAPHLLHFYNVKGLIIFAVSDPNIYGYDINVNVLKGREFLKNLQFEDWRKEDFNIEAFVKPQEIINQIHNLIK